MRIIFLFLLSVSSLFATTYYVETEANGGLDSNSGLSGAPKATLNGALAVAALSGGGHTIQVGPGTFAALTATPYAGSSDGSRITIQGTLSSGTRLTTIYGLAISKSYYTVRDLICQGMINLASAATTGVTVDNCEIWRSFILVNLASGTTNFSLINSEIHHNGSSTGAVNLVGTGHLVENCYFHDNQGRDIFKINGTSNLTVRRCRFIGLTTGTGGPPSTTSTTTNTVGVGTKVFTVASSGLPYYPNDAFIAYQSGGDWNNTPGNGWMKGFILDYTGDQLTMQVISTYGSGSYSSWVIGSGSKVDDDHADIMQSFTYDSHDVLFERNFIKNCATQMGNFESNNNANLRDYTWRNNVIINSRLQANIYAQGFKFYNNTVYQSNWTNGWEGKTSATKGSGNPITVFNNIFCQVGTPASGASSPYSGFGGSNDYADYNFLSNYPDDAIKSATGYTLTGSRNINDGAYTPYDLFVDPDNDDLRLKPGSPAIGSGADVSVVAGFTDDYNGSHRNTWDRGAYAYDTSPDTVAPTALASIDSTGTTLTLQLSEASGPAGTGGAGGVTLTASGGAVTVGTLSGFGTATLTGTLSRTIGYGEVVTWSYATANGIEDGFGNDLATVTNATVANNVVDPGHVDAPPNPRRRGVRGIF